MKILFISYGIYEYDGRLRELLSVSEAVGETYAVMLTTQCDDTPTRRFIHVAKENLLKAETYLTFIRECINAANKIKEPYILFADNFFAAIPALLLHIFNKPLYIIQDVRELYYPEEIKSPFGRLFCRNEIRLMKIADVALCANDCRADIMLTKYKLKKRPIVYENIRFLNDKYNNRLLDEKYKNMFDGKINIVSTGGLFLARGADKLVSAMSGLPDDYKMFILGGGTPADTKAVNNIIMKNKLESRVIILPKVPLGELRYVLTRCDIGIVHYHKRDDNNRYCASGKIYEYLAEGIPIVTTENEPLADFCAANPVGVADDTFKDGIMTVANDLDGFKARVRAYIKDISPEKNNAKCALEIKRRLKID